MVEDVTWMFGRAIDEHTLAVGKSRIYHVRKRLDVDAFYVFVVTRNKKIGAIVKFNKCTEIVTITKAQTIDAYDVNVVCDEVLELPRKVKLSQQLLHYGAGAKIDVTEALGGVE